MLAQFHEIYHNIGLIISLHFKILNYIAESFPFHIWNIKVRVIITFVWILLFLRNLHIVIVSQLTRVHLPLDDSFENLFIRIGISDGFLKGGEGVSRPQAEQSLLCRLRPRRFSKVWGTPTIILILPIVYDLLDKNA